MEIHLSVCSPSSRSGVSVHFGKRTKTFFTFLYMMQSGTALTKRVPKKCLRNLLEFVQLTKAFVWPYARNDFKHLKNTRSISGVSVLMAPLDDRLTSGVLLRFLVHSLPFVKLTKLPYFIRQC